MISPQPHGDRKSSWQSTSRSRRVRSAAKSLGPGVITGAADEDPSSVATYTSHSVPLTDLRCLSLLRSTRALEHSPFSKENRRCIVRTRRCYILDEIQKGSTVYKDGSQSYDNLI